MKQIGVLAILFTVLLAAVITKEVSRPAAGSLSDQVALMPLGPKPFAAADVTSFEVSGPGGDGAFSVRRDGERWLVDGDFVAPAAAGVVTRFLEAAAAARGELRLEDATKLGKFDLSPERTTSVTLRGAGDTELAKFAVGRTSGEQGAFVRLLHDDANSDAAYVVAKDLRAGLGLRRSGLGDEAPATPQAAHFHDLGLPPIAVDGAARVDLVSPLWTLAFEKAGPEWAPAADAPQDLPLKPSGLKSLVQQLSGSMNGTALVDPARRTELGLDAPAYRVQVTLTDGSARAAIGAADRAAGKFYVRLDAEQEPDVLYETTGYAWEQLFPPGSRLFDFKTLDVEDDGLTRLEISGGDAEIALSRPGGRSQDDWTVDAPTWTLMPRQSQLKNVGALLRGVRPVDFVLGDVAFESTASVRWGREGEETLTALQIGGPSPTGTGRLAVFPGSPERVFVIADTTIDRIVPDALDLFERRPLHGVVEEDVTALAVRVPGGAEVLRVTRGEGGAWALQSGDAEHEADALRVSAWIGRLLDVEVEALAPESAAEPGSASGSAMATHEVVVERGTDLPIVIGVASGDAGATIVLGGAAFETNAGDLVPDAAALTSSE